MILRWSNAQAPAGLDSRNCLDVSADAAAEPSIATTHVETAVLEDATPDMALTPDIALTPDMAHHVTGSNLVRMKVM